MQVIVITGPTAVGKTKLSVEIAKRINGEIINADSTQIYKELDIATAKVTKEEMDGVVHHLIDIKNITEDYTVYDYQKDVRRLIDDIRNRGCIPIIVGGTGLYIKAALYDYQFDSEYKKDYSYLSDEELYSKVLELDPDNEIHAHNRKRLERALSYMESNNKQFSSKEKTDKLLYSTLFIGITTDRDILYERINNRVDNMMSNGLLEEAKKIYDKNIRSKAVMTPIGYKELFPYFEGNQELVECINSIKKNSRHYAKRQYTWFNNQMDIKWFNVDFKNFNNTIDEVYKYIEKSSC